MNKYLILILSIMVMTCSKPQNSAILEKMINKLGNDFPDIVSHPKKHRLQVLYTQIDRDKNNKYIALRDSAVSYTHLTLPTKA